VRKTTACCVWETQVLTCARKARAAVAFTFASAGSTKCTNSRPGFNRAWMAPTCHHSQPQHTLS
jgi:hypothetical protein